MAAAICAVLLAFLALAAAIDGGSILLHVDRPVQLWMLGHRWDWLQSAARAATELGAPAPAFALGLALTALTWRRSSATGFAILVLTLARPLASSGLKVLVDRDRPSVGTLVATSGQSFPSGHTLAAAILFGSVTLAASAWEIRGRAIIAVGCVAAVALVGATRVYLGVHWLSDVVGGALLGGLLLAVVRILLARGSFDAVRARRRSLT
ncbi:MAG: phosphatidic acid phosphatase, type 2 [Pseudonocardiales bacterium]|nr:phosphatidic acid phosphatase, type 2 [Pseudonocardiales bacterium]